MKQSATVLRIARCAPAILDILARRGVAAVHTAGACYPLAAYLTHAAVRTYAATAKKLKRGLKVTAKHVEHLLTRHLQMPEIAPMLATAEGIIIPASGAIQTQNQRLILFSESLTELPRPHIIRGTAAVEEAAAIIPVYQGLLTTAAEVAAEMQRIKSVPYEVLVERITETGVQLGYFPTSIMQAIENFKNPRVNVTIDMFGEGIFRFRNIPGGEEVIHNVFKNMIIEKNCNRANGAIYELAGGTVFEIAENEKMLELAKRMPKVDGKTFNEHDFMTKNYLGECKNVCWPKFSERIVLNKREIEGLIEQLTTLATHASELSKRPLLIMRNPISYKLHTELHGILQLIIDLNIKSVVISL